MQSIHTDEETRKPDHNSYKVRPAIVAVTLT